MTDAQLASVTERTIDLARALLASHGTDRAIAANDRLSEVGLTSLDLVSLMIAVEGEFDLMIPPSYITPQNFQSAATIAHVVVAVRSKAEGSALPV